MRKLMLGALAAALMAPVLPAAAEARPYYGDNYRQGYGNHGYGNQVQREQRECRRELRRADSRREYRRELRECRREIARARENRNWRNDRRGSRYDRYEDSRRGYRGW